MVSRKQSPKRTRFIAVLILVVAIVLKVLIWDRENNRWLIRDLYYQAPLAAKLTLAPPIAASSPLLTALIPTEIDDASKLNVTPVMGVLQPRTEAEIQSIVRFAQSHGKKISLSGARHSMGGQIAYPHSLHLDMTRFDQMQYNPQDQTLTVQSGATWKQIQIELGKQGRSVRVMQDSNIFTLGGSMAVNAHGKDSRFGSLIESINFFKLVNAKGQEIRCSRQENPQLFYATIGGMGLLGVITEVNLKTEVNATYRYTVVHKPLTDAIAYMEEQIQRPELEMIEAQVSVDQANFLGEAQIYYFDKIEPNPSLSDNVSGENSIWLRKMVYRCSRSGNLGKQFRWFMQKNIGLQFDPAQLTRNSAMAAPFRTLELSEPETTDILQEYFVPVNQVDSFLQTYRQLLLENNLSLINVTIRKVNPDPEALVSYATQDMYAFVAYYKISKSALGQQQMTRFTQTMMDSLQSIEGKFYLAYKGYYSQQQLYRMYPTIEELFRLKRQFDPQELFYNRWYAEFKPI